ncbi:MAG: pyruvate dehydrogenase (acetyl-transferring) E1 component subunit alpha [Armatimonadota bacterium]
MLTDKEKIDIYREMVVMRKFEEKAQEMYEARKIGGFLHLYIGQEAVASGTMWALRPDDYVIGAYREHGQALARCTEPRRLMAELFGKKDGMSGGKGGSMHLFDKTRGFLGGTAIVGGGLPLACGVGFAIRYWDGDQVCLCFFGDGAINEGAFHESLHMAALWELPVIFICENNQYGMGTSVERHSIVPNLYQRAQCYSMDVESVDGMDLLAVYELSEKAIEKTRKTKQPMFIEAVTYRFRGHSVADPQKYRTKEEVEEYKKRDPIIKFAEHLKENKLIDDDGLEKINKDVDKEIAEAVEFAELSPDLTSEDLYTDVYI